MKKFVRSVWELLEQLIITLFVVALIFTYIIKNVSVVGDSMRNSLMDGDKVIINMLDKEFQRGEIIVAFPEKAVTLNDKGGLSFAEGPDKVIIKRVIAAEGQTVDIDFATGAVEVDGERLYENYLELGLTHYDGGAFTDKYPITVPEGYVFVMGDNRSVSLDSRDEKIGFVAEKDIMGTVVLRYYPEFEVYS